MSTPYKKFLNAKISIPAQKDFQPDELLLERHYEQFVAAQNRHM